MGVASCLIPPELWCHWSLPLVPVGFQTLGVFSKLVLPSLELHCEE